MYRQFLVLIIAICTGQVSTPKGKMISAEEAWDGIYKAERLVGVQSMRNCRQYTVLNKEKDTNTTNADLYNYPELFIRKYLLFYGSGDDHVLQHPLRKTEALIQENKQIKWAIPISTTVLKERIPHYINIQK